MMRAGIAGARAIQEGAIERRKSEDATRKRSRVIQKSLIHNELLFLAAITPETRENRQKNATGKAKSQRVISAGITMPDTGCFRFLACRTMAAFPVTVDVDGFDLIVR